MPDFLPFRGVRYDCDTAAADLATLVAPPYDVIDEDHRVALESSHVRNAVHLLLPRDGDRPDDRYERAATDYGAWLADGTLRTDPEPRFYSYRMEFRDLHGTIRHTLGVIGALVLPGDGDTSVLPHERTLPKAKSDRLALLRATRVNLDPIWGLSLTEGLTELLARARPLAECIDDGGVLHSMGSIDDAATIDAIRAAVAATPVVLADGHHRFETAGTYARELAASGTPLGGAGAIMTFVVELADDELSIEPIHRLLEIAPGVAVRERIADAFELHDAGPNTPEGVEALEARMAADGGLGVVDDRGLAVAVPRAGVVAAALADVPAPVAATDAAIVEHVVVPRLREATWQYRHDAAAVAAFVDKGAASAALLLRPVSVAQTRAAALAAVRMPQKTTFFRPKPRSGMVFRSLDVE